MRGRIDIIIFLVAVGWMALKFFSAWLEQRAAGRRGGDAGDGAPPARRRPATAATPPPVITRRVTVSRPASPAPAAPPAELGEWEELRDLLRGTRAESARAVPPVLPPAPMAAAAPTEEEADVEREGLAHQASAPLKMLGETNGAGRPAGVPGFRRGRAVATALGRAARCRSSLRQAVLLSEVIGRPRAFDV